MNEPFKFLDHDPRSTGRRRRGDPIVAEFAAALRDNPGRWAEWPYPVSGSYVHGLATRINCGDDKAPPPLRGGEFQAVTRSGVLYIRFAKDGDA